MKKRANKMNDNISSTELTVVPTTINITYHAVRFFFVSSAKRVKALYLEEVNLKFCICRALTENTSFLSSVILTSFVLPNQTDMTEREHNTELHFFKGPFVLGL